jgi:hypothetical protein
VFSHVRTELQSGDLCIPGSAQVADDREQLISWEAYHETVAAYGAQVGWPVESTAFVTQMRTWLEESATATDVAFPSHTAVRLVEGEPVLRTLTKRPTPRGLRAVEQLMAARLEPVNILDVLTDTETWLQWTRPFGLFSGRDGRIDAARARYIATTFGSGCNLGPPQTHTHEAKR